MSLGLIDLVNDAHLLSVSVDTKQVVGILEQLAARLAAQDDRHSVLESFVRAHVDPARRMEELNALRDAQQRTSADLLQLRNEFAVLARAVADFQASVEARLNDMLMCHTTALAAAVGGLHEAIGERASRLAADVARAADAQARAEHAAMREFADVNTRVKYLSSEFMKHCAAQAHDLLELQGGLQQLRSAPPPAAEQLPAPAPPPPPPEPVVQFVPSASGVRPLIDPIREDVRLLRNQVANIERDIDDRTIALRKLIEGKFGALKEMLSEQDEAAGAGKGADGLSLAQGIELTSAVKLVRASQVKLGLELAALKQQVEELASRPAPEAPELAGPPPASVSDAIEARRHRERENARFDRIDAALDSLASALAGLADQLAALEARQAGRDGAYRSIVYALIDGLRTVHAFADGMQGIPVQNFARVAREYFLEDPTWETLSSQYVKRFPPKAVARAPSPPPPPAEPEPEAEAAPEPEPTPELLPPPDPEPQGPAGGAQFDAALLATLFSAETRRRSGLLHLVGHAVRSERSAPTIENNALTVVANPTFADDPLVTTQMPTFAVRAELTAERVVIADIVGDGAAPSGISDETLRELRYLVGTLMREKADIISALDRKVDREFIERLFNKFRTMIVAVNERVREMAAMTEKFATQKEVQAVAQLVYQIPEFNETAASRVGPECLICGRTRGQAGAAQPSEDDEAAHYVYAEGGMFRKTAGVVGRIGLPPLKPP
jgi:hypothetical protein